MDNHFIHPKLKIMLVASIYGHKIDIVRSEREVPPSTFSLQRRSKLETSVKAGKTSYKHWVVSESPKKKHLDKGLAAEYLEHPEYASVRIDQIKKGLNPKVFITSNNTLSNVFFNKMLIKDVKRDMEKVWDYNGR